MTTHASRWYAALVVAVLLATGAGATALARQSSTTQARVDAVFSKWTSSTPGCAVGVRQNGAIVLEKAFGMADLELGVPLRADSIFEAGSVSKQFTAAAVTLLARDGKLSLDDQARKYIPELPNYGAPLTIRHMLTHTSGLRDWGNVAAIAGWPRGTRVHTHAHVLDIVSRQSALNFPSGTRYSYSNTGYNLSAVLVSRVSGQSLSDFTEARIFTPLGMTQTSWRDDFTRVVKNRAIAYGESSGTFSLDMPFENVYGQGGLLTTVGDLLRWTGNFSQPKVGDAEFVKEMLAPGRFSDGRPHDYALGLRVSTYQGLREVSHSGATAGYRAWLSEYPERQLAVAVLCNVASANATQHARAVAEIYLGITSSTETPSGHGATPANGLDGLYRRSDTGAALRVSRVGSDLHVGGGTRLTAQSPTRFKAANGAAYEFASDALTITDTFGTIDRYTLLKGERLNTRPLEGYAGTYDCVDAETILTAAVVDGVLVLRRRPDSVIRLTPAYADTFESSLGLIRFHRDTANAIVSLGISDERVWDLRCGKK